MFDYEKLREGVCERGEDLFILASELVRDTSWSTRCCSWTCEWVHLVLQPSCHEIFGCSNMQMLGLGDVLCKCRCQLCRGSQTTEHLTLDAVIARNKSALRNRDCDHMQERYYSTVP